ncbi:sortase [Vibrio cholerae]|nr:sortase [Vibrio cholerae]
MIIFIPNLGQSEAAQDRATQSTSTPTSAPAPVPEGLSAEAPTPTGSHDVTPPSPGGSSTPTAIDQEQAADAAADPSSPDGVAPTRITVPSAGIDVAVLPLVPSADELASQSIVPPITDDGYWLTSYGAPGPGSTDTTYIAGHSWEGREAPFDLFSTNTKPGDMIILDTMAGPLTYIVDAVTTHDKDSLKDSDIWEITPDRLVIISCFTEDPWGKNVVVTASPAN